MKKLFIALAFLLSWANTNAQVYKRLIDATGGSPSAGELSNLEAAVQDIIEILPTQYKKFKVYDFGYYVHNELMGSAYDNIFSLTNSTVLSDTSSDYYVLFGRESSFETGLNKNVRLTIKLPAGAPFNCFSSDDLANITNSVSAIANGEGATDVYKHQVEALHVLKEYIRYAVECNCTPASGGNCNLNSNFTMIDARLRGLGFRKKQIELGVTSEWVNGSYGIYDYSGKKVVIDGSEYYIPEEIQESKIIFDATTQELPDTVINTSITGEVYILDNESFSNGQWEYAYGRAASVDYVEYWAILTDNQGKSFLYSRYTLGAFQGGPAVKGDSEALKRQSMTTSPWGEALKVLGNAAVDACMQAAIYRIVDKNVNDWPTAWGKVSYLGAAWEGLTSLLPWKTETVASTLITIAGRAFVVVLDRAINEPNYTVSQGISDFFISLGSSTLTQLIGHPKTIKLIGSAKNILFSQGLARIFKSNGTPYLVKRVITYATYYLCNGTKRTISLSSHFIPGNISKTTTILGRLDPDINTIIKEILPHEINVGVNFGWFMSPNKGGFNVLKTEPYDWLKKNVPWLNAAIARGDDIFLATIPTAKSQLLDKNNNPIGIFAKEIKILATENIRPVNITQQKWTEIRAWFGING